MQKLFFLLALTFSSVTIAANVNGWAWSSNIGWVSFNQVGINLDTGEFNGYAWSDGIGWIQMNPKGPYPAQPFNSAQVEADNIVYGWARALAATADNSGDWDGWIKFSGNNYKVQQVTDPDTGCYLSGYAWGSDVIGWLRFGSKDNGDKVTLGSCASGGAPPVDEDPPPQIICDFSANIF